MDRIELQVHRMARSPPDRPAEGILLVQMRDPGSVERELARRYFQQMLAHVSGHVPEAAAMLIRLRSLVL